MAQHRRLTLLPVLLLFAACAREPYPYPPQFVSSDAMPAPELPAPPANDSPTYAHEIDRILAHQARLSAAQKAVLVRENHIAPAMIITPVLGTAYSAERFPKLYALLQQAGSDAWRISDQEEDYWMSPRPWYADHRVQLLVPKITRPGYPSGHTTTNTVWASILADLFPAKRSAFFARASAIGYHRVDGGAHFPHDVEGGKKLGTMIYAQMQANPEFQAALQGAREEITANATPLRRGRIASGRPVPASIPRP